MRHGWTLADGEFLPLPMALAFSDDDDGLDEDWDEDEDLDEDGDLDEDWDDEDDEWDESDGRV